jgi:hypothetical protein
MDILQDDLWGPGPIFCMFIQQIPDRWFEMPYPVPEPPRTKL